MLMMFRLPLLLSMLLTATSLSAASQKDICYEAEQAFNAGDITQLTKMLNTQRFTKRVRSRLGLPDHSATSASANNDHSQNTQLAAVAADALLTEFMQDVPPSSEFACIGHTSIGSQHYAVIRILFGNGGMNYFALLVDGQYAKQFNDWYLYASALHLSTTYAQQVAASEANISVNQNAVASALGLKRLHADELKRLNNYHQHLVNGNIEAAMSQFAALPKELRNNRALLLNNSLYSPDGSAHYRSNLNALAQQHGNDSSLSFMLMDYYLLEKRYDALRRAIISLPRILRNDPAVLNYAAIAEISQQNFPAGISLAKRAASGLPSWPQPQLTLLDAYVFSKDYSAAVQQLNLLDKELGLPLSLADIRSFADGRYLRFAESAEAAAWAKPESPQ